MARETRPVPAAPTVGTVASDGELRSTASTSRIPVPGVNAWTGVVVVAVAAGLALRVWIFTSPLSALEADEAITGLMARHVLDGEVKALYWLSPYGGSLEAFLTAPVFAVFGSSVLTLKLVPLALFAVATVLLWRVGRRTVGEPAARIAAALFWIWPAYLVWWTTKARAYYMTGLVCWLAAFLLVLRIRERGSRLEAAALGLVLGLGWWTTPQTAMFAGPLLVWLVWQRPAVLRLAWAAVPAFVLGASPWFASLVRGSGATIFPQAVAGAESSYLGRLVDLFRVVLPTWLGLRVPFSLDWLLGPAVGAVATALAVSAAALALARRPRRLRPLLAILAPFPFLYAAATFTYFVAEPRYLVLFAPVPALLLGYVLARRLALAVPALAAAFALSVAGLVAMERDGLYQPIAPDVRVPADLSPLLDLLEREGVDRVLADYWLAYRISFESDERVIATSTGFVRYAPHDRLVRSDPRRAYVFVRGSASETRQRRTLTARGYRRLVADGFVAFVPG